MKRSGLSAFIFSLLTAALVVVPFALQVSAVHSVSEMNDVNKNSKTLHTAGIVGSFNEWTVDGEIQMVNDNGIWKGAICLPSPDAQMIVQATTDDGSGAQVPRKRSNGKEMYGITFKVRLDGSWDDSWGDYEPLYDRTYNSQTNCCVLAKPEIPILIGVKLDTTKNTAEALENSDSELKEDAKPEVNWLPVEYKAVGSVGELEDYLDMSGLDQFNVTEGDYSVSAAYAVSGDDADIGSTEQTLTTETVSTVGADQSQTTVMIIVIVLSAVLGVGLIVILIFAVRAVRKR